MLDTSKPHTVVVVTSTCRLPFAKGRLGPGVYHFVGDQRRYISTVYWKKQAKASTIYFMVGDTEQALKTIAALKNQQPTVDPVEHAITTYLAGAKPVEFEGDTSALGDDPSPDFIMGNGARLPSGREALQAMEASGELARRLGHPVATSTDVATDSNVDAQTPESIEAALQELSDLGQEIGAEAPLDSDTTKADTAVDHDLDFGPSIDERSKQMGLDHAVTVSAERDSDWENDQEIIVVEDTEDKA